MNEQWFIWPWSIVHIHSHTKLDYTRLNSWEEGWWDSDISHTYSYWGIEAPQIQALKWRVGSGRCYMGSWSNEPPERLYADRYGPAQKLEQGRETQSWQRLCRGLSAVSTKQPLISALHPYSYSLLYYNYCIIIKKNEKPVNLSHLGHHGRIRLRSTSGQEQCNNSWQTQSLKHIWFSNKLDFVEFNNPIPKRKVERFNVYPMAALS